MTRKLASIRVVAEIRPILNADQIELAIVDGWQVVVRKGEMKAGDLGVYFEIDSFLPIRDEFEFLRKSSYRKMGDAEGFRLKTIKLRGQLSQGLLLPQSLFPELAKCHVGMDVSDILGVVKYDPPLPASLAGTAKGRFPGFVRKTDEERVQNLGEWFNIYSDVEFELTEKLDGSSMTVYHFDGDSGVCSRNLELVEDGTNTFWIVARKLRVLEAVQDYYERYKRNLAIQGECVGFGINKNPLGLKEQTMYVFNIFDIDRHRYLTPDERIDVLHDISEDTGIILHQVPCLGRSFVLRDRPSIDAVLEFVRGKSIINPGVEREGIVFKSTALIDDDIALSQDIISFKAINNDYLLKDRD